MSTETTTETSLEHWVMELPEDEAACEWPQGCTRVPEWAFVGPCGCSTPMCDPHHHLQESEARRLVQPFCKVCKRDVVGWSWHRI